MSGVAGARWQDDAQLHATLRFIGEVDHAVAEDIALALAAVVVPPLTLSLAGVGMFDSRGRPNALWAGLAPREPIAVLHRKIDHALVRLGLAPERRAYLPHVTLARMKAAPGSVETWLKEYTGLSSAPFTLDHFLLFESRLGRAGASYEAIARYPLR